MKTIELHGAGAVTLQQQRRGHKARGGGPGGVVWPCGESLARWLVAQAEGGDGRHTCALDDEVHRALRDGTVSSVLELGCGTGVVGLTLAGLGASHVVTTDGDARWFQLCAFTPGDAR